MANNKDLSISNNETGIVEIAIDIYVFAILCIFPLFLTDAYFNVLISKYYFYVFCTLGLLGILILVCLLKREKVILYFKSFDMKAFLKRFTIADTALCTFLIIAALSTITSDYVYESFWGNEGRYSGMFLLSLYGISYFLLTRFGRFKKWYLDAFLVSGFIVCLLGISDYFHMDIMGFKQNMSVQQRPIFTSTIGNINTYTAIVGMLAGLSATLFCIEKGKLKNKIYYAVSLVINLFALFMGVSDNAYLSLAALLGLLPLYLFQNRAGIKRYLIVIATFFSVIQCIAWINSAFGDKVVGIESAFNLVADFSGLLLIIIALWAIVIILQCFDKRFKHSEYTQLKWPRYLWLGMLILFASGICFLIWDVNLGGNSERYGSLCNYLLFNDDWGTHRGYIWRNAIECFNDFSPWKKIVGFGPDTFGILLLEKTSGNSYREIFDNAHNEYIHYLVTVGLGGLIAYLVFLAGACTRMIRQSKHNVVLIAICFPVICYLAQASVNLNLPIATPLLWMLLALGEMGSRGVGNHLKK